MSYSDIDSLPMIIYFFMLDSMIFTKLLEIQKRNISVSKDAVNPHFKSKYVTLDAILDKYNSVLSEVGVIIYHTMQDNTITTTLYDTEDSTSIYTQFPLLDLSNPQKIGATITYAKRYNLGQLLNIVTDEDDDGNKASQSKPVFGEKNFEKMKAYIIEKWADEAIKVAKTKYELWAFREKQIKYYAEKLV